MNLKHLRYFWAVARWGGVLKAAERLHLTPQTLSGQIKLLERQLGVELFHLVGKKLELSDAGRVAYSYAEDIFSVTEELKSALQTLPSGRTIHFRVGITDGVPRSLAHQLLAPAFDSGERIRLSCSHERLQTLLSDLALQRLDLVIADTPVPPGSRLRVFNHALGTSEVGLFARSDLARRLRRGFPKSLHEQPMLLPGPDNTVHRSVRQWLDSRKLAPVVVGEFDDSALMKAFGAAGMGVFPAPLAVRAEIERNYGLGLIGIADGLSERYFAISAERRNTHPATRSVLAKAGATLQRSD
jgi:LysR family transcriptional regulator, transcriptional activator of nhaA